MTMAKFKYFFAKHYNKLFSADNVIFFTGTVGKSTALYLSSALLSQKFSVLDPINKENSSSFRGSKLLSAIANPLSKRITTSEYKNSINEIVNALIRIRKSSYKLLLEFSPNSREEMNDMINLVKPGIIVMTQISTPTSSDILSIEELQNEYFKLINANPKSLLILNWDDLNTQKIVQSESDQNIFYYGSDSENCHLWAGNFRIENFKTKFELNYGVERVEINSQLLGFHQVSPQLAAASLGINLGFPLTTIKKVLESVGGLESHMQAMPGYGGSVIIDDTCEISPQSLEGALNTLNHLLAKKRIVVLGEIDGLGLNSEAIHKDIARKIYKDNIDFVFIIGEHNKFLSEELGKLGYSNMRLFSDLNNSQITNKLLKVLSKGDIVLLKGSKNIRFDEIIKRITKAR